MYYTSDSWFGLHVVIVGERIREVVMEEWEEISPDIDEETEIDESPFLDNISKLSHGSHKLVRVRCQYNIADTCRPIVIKQYRAALEVVKFNNGKYICSPCAASRRASGRSNCRYKSLDEKYFSTVDTEAKGYLLGWIASDGHVRHDGAIMIQIHEDDEETLQNLRNSICSELPIKKRTSATTPLVGFTVHSKFMMKDICRLLGIVPGKKSNTVNFPQGLTDEISWAFLRGLFDGDGTLRKLRGKKVPHVHCAIGSTSPTMKEAIGNFVGDLNYHIRDDTISFTGPSCIKFLNGIYGNAHPLLRLRRKYDLYLDYVDYTPGLFGHYGKFPNCKYVKTRLDAFVPKKIEEIDNEYYISLIDQISVISENTIRYETGIKVQATDGWRVELSLRDCLVDAGYSLLDDGSLADNSYRQTVKVTLVKVKPDALSFKLPIAGIQMRVCRVEDV